MVRAGAVGHASSPARRSRSRALRAAGGDPAARAPARAAGRGRALRAGRGGRCPSGRRLPARRALRARPAAGPAGRPPWRSPCSRRCGGRSSSPGWTGAASSTRRRRRGVDLGRLLIVRPGSPGQAPSVSTCLWAARRCSGRGRSRRWWSTSRSTGLERGWDAMARRLQAAAEKGGAVGLWLASPRAAVRVPAALRLDVFTEGGRVAARRIMGGPGAGAGGGGPCGLIRSRAPRASPARPGPGAGPGRRGCSRSTCPISRCSGSGGSRSTARRPSTSRLAALRSGRPGRPPRGAGTGARWRSSTRGGSPAAIRPRGRPACARG